MKRENDYFKTFVKLVDYSCSASKLLHEIFSDYGSHNLEERMQQMHAVEHSADDEKHEMMKKLVREFITPIEREDIIALSQEIDDVTDTIEDVVIRLYMYNVHSIRADALEFSSVILKCCEALKVCMEEFYNFNKSTIIHELIVKVNGYEEDADKLYCKAVRNLFIENPDSTEIIIWKEIYEKLEKCCDSCEHVANVVESIIMKNT
ncbi:DUF47 family protein [Paludicola sp. MB14-C6]|uniref:DUF47 domain-containing protein n=1 Tax=Paludihabitans sp. MB14-C6 TaxID=3070656 RepID=UPI0027DBAD38|nr:DUF47 family protein [Paludicola sp. MB14-C6]WMJ23378.1 DUF47 family protein [Paludicola sp. MB14-C6]